MSNYPSDKEGNRLLVCSYEIVIIEVKLLMLLDLLLCASHLSSGFQWRKKVTEVSIIIKKLIKTV